MKLQVLVAAIALAVLGSPVTRTFGDDGFNGEPVVNGMEPVLASFAYAGDDECKGGCGKSACSCKSGLLGGLIKPTSSCFSSFISPMTNPIYFEDPRTLTEARLIYMNHNVPTALFGNSIQVLAMQVRAAVTEDLSIIATKDGYIFSDNALVGDGWADIAAGLKLNILKDYDSQTIVSVGSTYSAPFGSAVSLQKRGDGEFHLFMTGGTEFAPDTHWVFVCRLIRTPAAACGTGRITSTARSATPASTCWVKPTGTTG